MGNTFEIDEKFMQDVVAYLLNKPFVEVVDLMHRAKFFIDNHKAKMAEKASEKGE
jgi:hypothetical protein